MVSAMTIGTPPTAHSFWHSLIIKRLWSRRLLIELAKQIMMLSGWEPLSSGYGRRPMVKIWYRVRVPSLAAIRQISFTMNCCKGVSFGKTEIKWKNHNLDQAQYGCWSSWVPIPLIICLILKFRIAYYDTHYCWQSVNLGSHCSTYLA